MTEREEINPQQAVNFIYKHGCEYAKAKAHRVYLEEFRKSKKSILMRESGLSAVAAQEVAAYAHPEYLELLAGLEAAVEAEESLRWALVAAQARVEVWRSQEASNRALDRAAA